MSQRELAEKIGVTAASLSAYERGTQTPSIEAIAAIADVFDVKIDWLCSRPYYLNFHRKNKEINKKNMEDALNGLMAIATEPDLMTIEFGEHGVTSSGIDFLSTHIENFLFEACQLEEVKQTRAFSKLQLKSIQEHRFVLERELHTTLISTYANLILNELEELNGGSAINGSNEPGDEEPPFSQLRNSD